MTAVDSTFQQFTNPKIKLHIAGVIVGEHMPFIKRQYGFDTFKTLKDMKHFFGNQTIKIIYPFDIVLLLTGEELFRTIDGWDGKYGLSEIGRACDYVKGSRGKNTNNANIIVQDLGQFSGVKVAAHHIGHLLGSYEDGEMSSAKCCSDDGYVMSASLYNERNINGIFSGKRNAQKWSPCSIESITRFVHTAPCLFNTPDIDAFPLLEWTELAKGTSKRVPHLHEQCSIYMKDETPENHKAYACETKDPCQYLQCNIFQERVLLLGSTKEHATYRCLVQARQYAVEGSGCGFDKYCYQGNCITGNYSQYVSRHVL